MARFRRFRAAEGYNWHRVPTAWKHWSEEDFNQPRYNHPEEHRSAIVHHNEQRFALEVMPHRLRPGMEPETWYWGIHKHGEDPHVDWQETEWTAPGNWADDYKYHPLNPSPAKYMGRADSPEEAMRAAQENWEKHKSYIDSMSPYRGSDGGGGDYDINDIMRRFSEGEL